MVIAPVWKLQSHFHCSCCHFSLNSPLDPSDSFSQYPELVSVGEGWNKVWLVNQELWWLDLQWLHLYSKPKESIHSCTAMLESLFLGLHLNLNNLSKPKSPSPTTRQHLRGRSTMTDLQCLDLRELRSFLTMSVTSAKDIGRSLQTAPSSGDVLDEFRSFSKCFFHQPVIFPVRVSSSLLLKTAWAEPCFLLRRCWMISQNLLGAKFSMPPLNHSYTLVMICVLK